MKGILLVSASPRPKGNCDDAAGIVLTALAARGCHAEWVKLHERQIERCRGCLNCQQGNKCTINDDFASVWNTVKRAETVVLFIPVYWCSPPGLMKDFIDRTVADFKAGGVMRDKNVYLISIAQSAGFEPQEEIIGTWIRWLGGKSLKTRLRLIAFNKGQLASNASATRKLKKLAADLADQKK